MTAPQYGLYNPTKNLTMVHIEAPTYLVEVVSGSSCAKPWGFTYDVMDDTETSTLLPFLATWCYMSWSYMYSIQSTIKFKFKTLETTLLVVQLNPVNRLSEPASKCVVALVASTQSAGYMPSIINRLPRDFWENEHQHRLIQGTSWDVPKNWSYLYQSHHI